MRINVFLNEFWNVFPPQKSSLNEKESRWVLLVHEKMPNLSVLFIIRNGKYKTNALQTIISTNPVYAITHQDKWNIIALHVFISLYLVSLLQMIFNLYHYKLATSVLYHADMKLSPFCCLVRSLVSVLKCGDIGVVRGLTLGLTSMVL